MVHVRYNGRSFELHEKELGIGSAAHDNEVKTQVANYLDINKSQLNTYVVDRTKSGSMILRPEAVYG